MRRHSKVETKVYSSGTGRWRLMTWSMVFVSCMLVLSGLLGPGSSPADLTVIPSGTPAPTQIPAVFDETPDSREITVPGSPWYAIQLGIYESAESAAAQAENYVKRGAAGYIWQDEARYRVLAAVYPDKEDAKAVRTQLKDGQQIDSYVYEIQPVALTLRLSGMAGQLDALEAGFQFLSESALQMQKLSVELDQREADQARALAGLAALAQKSADLRGVMTQRFTKPYHEVVDALLLLLEELEGRLAAAQKQEQPASVALAGTLKYDTLWLLSATQAYYTQLAQ